MHKLLLLVAVFVFGNFVYFPVHAQIKMGTGGEKGTYFAECNDIIKVCGAKVTLTCVKTGGSQDNVLGILDNTLSAGLAQFDVLKVQEDKDPNMARIRVLFPAHREEVHIIGLNKQYKEGGWLGFGSKSIELNTLKDLQGRNVVAWGGSKDSAEYFSFKSRLNFNVIDVSGQEHPELVAAKMLAEGQAHAIFAVGGAPLGWLKDAKVFGKQFKLLSVNDDIAANVKGVYAATRVNYPNLTNGSAQTVAVQSLFITRDYKEGDKAEALATLRQCVIDNMSKLSDSEGMHPKWQTIHPDEEFTGWAAYQGPKVAATSQGKKK